MHICKSDQRGPDCEIFIEVSPGRFIHRGTCRRHKLRYTSSPKHTQSLLSKNPGAPVGPLLPATTGLRPVDGAQPRPRQTSLVCGPWDPQFNISSSWTGHQAAWPASAEPDSWERREGWARLLSQQWVSAPHAGGLQGRG